MDRLLEFIANNTLLAAGTVAMALAVIFNELRIKAGGLSAVTPVQAVRLINGGAKIVDVRDAERFAGGHIVDSVNAPAGELPDKLGKKLRQASSVILVCDTGTRSGSLVAKLRKQGFEQVFSLRGGIGAWQRDNLPVVSGKDAS